MAGDQKTCGHWPPSDPSFSLWRTPTEWGRGGRGRAGEISAQRGWSENPRELGRGGFGHLLSFPSVCGETGSSPPFTERGLLAWTRPLSLGQVCCWHPGLCLGRLAHPLRSPSHPAGRGVQQQGLLVCHSFRARRSRARETCRGFAKVSVSPMIHRGHPGAVLDEGGRISATGKKADVPLSPHCSPLILECCPRGRPCSLGIRSFVPQLLSANHEQKHKTEDPTTH